MGACHGSRIRPYRRAPEMIDKYLTPAKSLVQNWQLAAAIILIATGSIAAVPASAIETHATITNVSVSPQNPAPDELTRIEATIQNVGNRSQAVEITDLYVRYRGRGVDVTHIENLGTIPGGGKMRVPLTATFDNSGVRRLRIVALGENQDGDNVRLEYPLTVVVSDGGPQLDIDVSGSPAGSETSVAINVTNGDQSEIRNLRLTTGGSNVTVDDATRIAAVLPSGSERTFEYTVVPQEGQSTVEATLQYTTTEGQTRSVRATRGVSPRAANAADRPQLQLSVPNAVPGATRPVNVTVANGLNQDVRQVRVVASSSGANLLVDERVRARVAAGQDATFQFPARVDAADTYSVNVTLLYSENGLRRQITRSFEATFGKPDNPGGITLTGVEAVQRGQTLELSATAGNVGSNTVEGVVVSVADTPNVTSADYFVGSVEGSDFATFTLTTSVTGNVSSVPVEIRYAVGGVERTTTTQARVDRAAVESVQNRGGGVPVGMIAGGFVLLVAAGAVYRRWR